MATDEIEETILFSEQGSGGRPLLFGPLFGVAGYLLELFTRGPTHLVPWLLVGLALFVASAVWVYARRRFFSVRLTTKALWQGREPLDLERIAEVAGVGAPVGARLLGGGWSLPKKYEHVPIKLDDGSVVLAWARDHEGLRSALSRVVRP